MTLEITDLQAGYGSRLVLTDITVPQIKRGQFLGLIGPNAAGKSTVQCADVEASAAFYDVVLATIPGTAPSWPTRGTL